MEDNDSEETLVLNFLDLVPSDTETKKDATTVEDAGEATKLDGSFDENQNKKIQTKLESPENTSFKMKKLVVMLDEIDLTPKKRKRKSKALNPLSAKMKKTATYSLTKENTAMPEKKRNSSAIKQNNSLITKTKTEKESPKLKKLVQQKLQFKPLAKKPANAKCNTNNDIEIKIENFYDDDVLSVSKPITKKENARTNPVDVVTKLVTKEKDHKNNPVATEKDHENNNQVKLVDVRSPAQEAKVDFIHKTDTEKNGKKKQATPRKSLKNAKTESPDSSNNDETTKVEKKPLEKKRFKCDHCVYEGSSKANLERHNMIHMSEDDILWYKCSECEYKSKYEAQLRSHVIIHKDPTEIEWFPCPHCDLKCSRKHNLTNHIKTAHLDRVNNFKCEKCTYATFSKDRLAAHLKSHSDKIFSCKLCKFMTKNDDYLKNHVKLKHSDNADRPFPCDTCSYKGRTKRELVRHYDRMHNKEKMQVYRCELCDFNSIYKKNMEFHVLHMHKNSEGFQKFICGHCNKDFAYKNGLKTHIIRIHLKFSEADWQRCHECKYKTKDVGTLKRHIKRNHGAPRLLCKQCQFATNRLKSMIAHEKTHKADSEDILKCPKCPYRIIQSSSFVYHMKNIHDTSLGSKDLYKFYESDDKKIKEKIVSESESE